MAPLARVSPLACVGHFVAERDIIESARHGDGGIGGGLLLGVADESAGGEPSGDDRGQDGIHVQAGDPEGAGQQVGKPKPAHRRAHVPEEHRESAAIQPFPYPSYAFAGRGGPA